MMKRLLPYLPWLLLLLVSAPFLLWELDRYPRAWFDEGFSMHVSKRIMDYGQYATYMTDVGLMPFDGGVSSGPTLIYPMTASFATFGVGIWQGRIISVLFAWLTLGVAYALGCRWSGSKKIGFAAALGVLWLPKIGDIGFILLSRQILGEPIAVGCIMLGVALLFYAWRKPTPRSIWVWSALSGLCMGVGVLAKSQVAIPLLPSLGILFLLRCWHKPKQFILWGTPIAGLLLVFLLWRVVEFFGLYGNAYAQTYNAELYQFALDVLLLPFGFGKFLGRNGWGVTGILVVVGVGLLWQVRVWTLPKENRAEIHWEKAFVGILCLVYAGWFSLVSVGWLRYSYMGVVFAWLALCSSLLPSWLRSVSVWLDQRFRQKWLTLLPNLLAGLALLSFGAWHTHWLVSAPKDDATAQTAQFIRQNIPASAMLETWEWELDALSGHEKLHHPHERYDFEAVEQIFHQNRAPHLTSYDPLHFDPDYLVSGVMSNYTRIYEAALAKNHFKTIARFGPYTVYQRQRSRSINSTN